MLKNALFLDKRKLDDILRELTGQMVTSRAKALTWNDAIELNVCMYIKTDCQFTKYCDHKLSSEVADAVWNQLDSTQFAHLADRLQLAELLQRLRQEMEEEHIFDIEDVLDQVVNVFKYEGAPDTSLQAALMASAAPSRAIQKAPEHQARSTT
jgi:hypothetical protein